MMTTQWPPPYKLRYSDKAKYLRLYIDKQGFLELVLPRRVKLAEAEVFLNTKRGWIEKHLQMIAARPPEPERPALPLDFYLHALHEHWRIEYQNQPASHYVRLFVHPLQHLIILQGKTEDPQKCYIHLEKWLRLKAKSFLFDLLTSISQEINMPFSQFSLRGQKTRWGSCSHNKAISLNFKLIFFPFAIARNIVIHELCHTVHLDHSKQFWQLVAKYDPHYEAARLELKTADRYLPKWLQ